MIRSSRFPVLAFPLLAFPLWAQETADLPHAAQTAAVVALPAFDPDTQPDVPMPPKALYQFANKAWQRVPDGTARRPSPDSPPIDPGPVPAVGVLAAPNDFRSFVASRVNPVGAFVSPLAEPATSSHAETVMYTGNTYGALSTDCGQTWANLNATTLFPNSDAGLCCDQKLLHIPGHDVTVWLLEYFTSPTTLRGRHRIAFARGAAGVRSRTWTFFDIDPQLFGFGNNLGLDYGDIAASSTHLYGSALVINSNPSQVGMVLWRLNLLDFLAGRPAPIIYYTDSQLGGVGGYRFAQGPAGSDMFWAAHEDTDTLRVYRWNDGAAAANRVSRGVASWENTPSPAPGPDNRDWTGFAFTSNCVLAGFRNGAEVGFMWSSGAHGNRPMQYVRVARFATFDRVLIAEHDIWNQSSAFHFPSACANDRGHVGGTMAFGGGGVFPAMVAYLADDISPWGSIQAFTVRSGSRGPNNNRWGDYQVTGRHSVAGNTWVGTGYVIDNAGAADHRFLWFGRERDMLTVPLAIRANLAVGAMVTAPIDVNGQGSGTTNFNRRYPAAQNVTLTAPRLASGFKVFDRWTVDNVNQPLDQLSVTVPMGIGPSHDAFARYLDGQVITVNSSETSVPITVSVTDLQNARNGNTTFMRVYKPGRSVTFTAPATFNGRPFWRWESSIAPQPPELQTWVTVSFSTSLRAVYGNHVAGSFTVVGTGCAGQNGLPLVQEPTVHSVPEIGRNIGFQVYDARPLADGFGIVDVPTNQLIFQWIRVATGCSVLARPVITVPIQTNLIGLAWMYHQVPNDVNLIGTGFRTQFFVVDNPNLWFGGGTISSNAIDTTLGGLR